jgi:hypothetical protein
VTSWRSSHVASTVGRVDTVGPWDALGLDDGNGTKVGTGATLGFEVVGELLGEVDGCGHALHVSGHCIQAALPSLQRRLCSLELSERYAQPIFLVPLAFKNKAVGESEQPSLHAPHVSSHTNHALKK